MKLSFDFRGYLKPYDKTTIPIEEFEKYFVSSFDKHSSRQQIFANYLRYVNDFKEAIGHDFIHWINGSFISNKENPGDIDFVTLLDYQIVSEKENILNERFLNQAAQNLYGTDAYLIRIYPDDHPYFVRTKSDIAYWNHWFGNSKMNRAKKRFSKGFVEIEFKAS